MATAAWRAAAASEVTEHDAVAIRAVRVLDSRVFDGVHPLKDIAAAHQRRPSAEAPRPWHVRHDSIDDPGRQRSTTRGG